MRLAIMQPYFFPYIGYFQLIHAVDKFVIYDDVNFINKGWINRNNILVNGKANLISIPLKEASQNKLINEIEIINDGKWKSKLEKTIIMSYKKAPFFNDVFPLVQHCLQTAALKISDYNLQTLKLICNYIGIKTQFIDSSAVYKDADLKAQNRILDICLQEKAAQYINPIGGTELYSADLFKEKKIKLNFIKTLPIEYKQISQPFVPFLSIIDVLMFNSQEAIKDMLDKFELI